MRFASLGSGSDGNCSCSISSVIGLGKVFLRWGPRSIDRETLLLDGERVAEAQLDVPELKRLFRQ